MLNLLLAFLLLSISFAGWGIYIHRKLDIHPAFVPLFLFSSITCVVFFGGLLNIMPLMVYLLFLVGLLLFALMLFFIWKKKYYINHLLIPSSFAFVLFTVIFVFLLKGLFLIHYDDFSHWGLIVKEMSRIDGLPDSTTQVTFRNYPPGSAVFIYFVGKMIGYSESHALMAQALLIAANISVLFVFCKWRRVGHLLLTLVSSIVLLVIIKNQLYNLLVDTLLGFTALSMTIIAYYYRDNWKRSLLVNTPIAVLLILTKDSGKFFLVINLILIVWFVYSYILKEQKDKRINSKILFYVLMFITAIPLGINYLWVKYTQKAYPQAAYSSNKFVVSIDKVSNNDKSIKFKEELLRTLVKAVTDFESPLFQSIFLLNALIVIIVVVILISRTRTSILLLKLFVFSNLAFIFYLIGLYGMYLFLMPEGEANRLAGFNRYYATMIIYLIGLLMTFLSYEISRRITDEKKNILVVLLVALLFILPYREHFIAAINRPDIQSSLRLKVKESYNKVYESGTEVTNVIYYSPQSKTDSGYLKYLLKYEQLGKPYSIITDLSSEEEIVKLNNLMLKSSHLIVLDSDSTFDQFIQLKNGIKGQAVYVIKKKAENSVLDNL